MSVPTIKNPRTAQLAIIHVAKKALGLDDETYRCMLESTTGKTSCKGMTAAQLDDVIAALKSKGFKPHLKQTQKPSGTGKRFAPAASYGYQRKIYAMWWQMADYGLVKKDRRAVRKWVERQTGISAPEFLDTDQANSCIEALKSWGARAEVWFCD